LKVPSTTAYIIVGIALLLASPFFILVGYLSDIYGRKPFMMAGIGLAVTTFYPIFMILNSVRPFLDVKAVPLVDNPDYSPVTLCFCVWLMVCYVALAYGPIAAFLVELFPTSIRYTSMSLPYHIGNGVFGGLVPVIGLSMTKATGVLYAGLWFPIFVAGLCLVGMIAFVPETYQVDITNIDNRSDEQYKA
jgi:MFS family permease